MGPDYGGPAGKPTGVWMSKVSARPLTGYGALFSASSRELAFHLCGLAFQCREDEAVHRRTGQHEYRPASTRARSEWATRAVSMAGRVFPMPGWPASSTTALLD
jgi:hypothetical protein